MTFGELKDRVKLTLGMNETVSNDESILIKAWLNEGVIDIISRTRPYSRVINLTVQANTPVHDMAGTIIALVDVELPGYGFLRRYTRQDIVDAQNSAVPGFAYEEPLFWFSPVVTEPTVIKAYGVFRPSDMVQNADDPANPTFGGLAEEFHPVILNYALWKAGEYVQHEGSGQGEKWRVQYEGPDGMGGDLARMKRILLKRVTPAAARRRNLTRDLGALTPSGEYIGAGPYGTGR
jgi:hypothetical protein